jgi:YXWGXW repeat-containing protein
MGVLSLTAVAAAASTHVGISLQIGRPSPIIVREAPPRRVVETVLVAPAPNTVWVGGHYTWQDNQWLWVPGTWVTPPQPGAFWVDGRWDENTKSWTEGHWELSQPTSPPPVVSVSPTPAPTVTEVIIHDAPPPVRVEHHGRRPGHGYVWLNGYWIFRQGRYEWISGRWALPPRGRHVWVAPRWERRGGAHVFIEGRWN